MNDPRVTTGRMLAFGPFVLGIVEIVVFVLVARWIGLGWTILLALLTSLVGFWVLRREGFRAWTRLRQAAAEGRIVESPENEKKVASTGAAMVAAVMLALPGFVTDVAGLVLLLPPVRKLVGRRLAGSALRSFTRRPVRGYGTYRARRADPGHPDSGSVVIEGEIVEPEAVRRRDTPRGESRDEARGESRLAEHEDPFDSDDPDGT